MRRPVVVLTLLAALAAAAPARAAFQPVRRAFGKLSLPRVHPGALRVPAGHAAGRVTVIVDLPLPPLAAYGRSLASGRAARRLDLASASSHAYLARLDAAQRSAAAELRRAIPEATVGRRFRVVLDGLTVELPVQALPTLVALPFVAHVYPSLRYSLALNRSRSLIGADVLERTTGALGDGVKIAIVDDGIDPKNPFFNPAGYSYPPGFPKGDRAWTTPKVIVARVFPGPRAGQAGRLPLDPSASFHGTHVAGIAAGDSGTNAPAGRDHPAVAGLAGVAPHAWLGNYRVFTVPTRIGNVASTPQVAAAFEAAVSDGMDVINFSGGGPATDPANDALIEVVHNVALAGVVPVIAAGNDRDDFGLGSAGSPGTAPDAISVAAVSNSHVFAPALSLRAPGTPEALKEIPFGGADGSLALPAWGAADQTLVDVGSLLGVDGRAADRRLCGPGRDPNGRESQLPAGSLKGAIALVWRGGCSFVSKADRARAVGAIGLVVVDNRPGEANEIPESLSLPSGTISDLDGRRLHEALAASGGRTRVRIGRVPRQIETGRGGVVTSFSSAGPTDFGHLLKPDLAAPGGQILSSTLPQLAGSPFGVLDGTSMATPHVAAAAALLVERHPGWTAAQIRSALVSTGGPAWQDTARTVEAPVTLEGGGLVNLPRADDPRIFTDPVSLSFGDLDVSGGAVRRVLLVTLADAGGGAGTWHVALKTQSAGAGAALEAERTVELAPGGSVLLAVAARAAADAKPGDDYGFVVLRNGPVTRRIPYLFSVARPGLEDVRAVPLRRVQHGSTLGGGSRASLYRYPSEPFGPPPDFTGPPVPEDGRETVYVTRLDRPAANLGVAVISSSLGSRIDPFLLGSLDENDVQGYAGTPVDVNELTEGFRAYVGAAAAVFPRRQPFFVAVDSGRDEFTGRPLAGSYVLRSWVNDVTPPAARLLTTRVAAGRPLLVARVVDAGAGVDPLSLAINYLGTFVGAASYDPVTGIALFPLSPSAPALEPGDTRGTLVASDFQEAKNVTTGGESILPNTVFQHVGLTAVEGPALTWVAPAGTGCLRGRAPLLAAASSTARIASVRFYDGQRELAAGKLNPVGLFGASWALEGAASGRHELRAIVVDRDGRQASASRIVGVCRVSRARRQGDLGRAAS